MMLDVMFICSEHCHVLCSLEPQLLHLVGGERGRVKREGGGGGGGRGRNGKERGGEMVKREGERVRGRGKLNAKAIAKFISYIHEHVCRRDQ